MFLIFFLLGSSFSHARECIPAYESVELPHNGLYHRIHPSGEYILFTSPSESRKDEDPEVFLIDLTGRKAGQAPVIIPTNLKGESYPVEPSWEYISSPASNGMEFFRFSDLINKTQANYRNAKPVMSDPQNLGYYHSFAEIAGKKKVIRSTKWLDSEMIDYEVSGTSAQPILKRSKPGHYCSNITIKYAEAERKASEKFGAAVAHLKAETDLSKKAALEAEKKLADDEWMRIMNLSNLATPIISKDGLFLATRYGNPDTIKIFKLKDNGDCESPIDTGYQGSKVSFSYPEKGKLPKIVFSDDDWLGAPIVKHETADGIQVGPGGKRIILYDLETKKSKQVNPPGEYRADYPGFAKDGRIIYSTGKGLSIADGIRISSNNQNCIAKESIPSDGKTDGASSIPGSR